MVFTLSSMSKQKTRSSLFEEWSISLFFLHHLHWRLFLHFLLSHFFLTNQPPSPFSQALLNLPSPFSQVLHNLPSPFSQVLLFPFSQVLHHLLSFMSLQPSSSLSSLNKLSWNKNENYIFLFLGRNKAEIRQYLNRCVELATLLSKRQTWMHLSA